MKRRVSCADADPREGASVAAVDAMWPVGQPVLTASRALAEGRAPSWYGRDGEQGTALRFCFCAERDGEGAGLNGAAEPPAQRYTVSCDHCGRRIAQAVRIRDPEIATIEEHVRRCSGAEALSDKPQLGTVLAHVRVNVDASGSGS